VRFRIKQISAQSCRFEQAFSPTAAVHWEKLDRDRHPAAVSPLGAQISRNTRVRAEHLSVTLAE
jgi:hypothetical protein